MYSCDNAVCASALPEQLSTCLERFKTKQVANKGRMRGLEKAELGMPGLGGEEQVGGWA